MSDARRLAGAAAGMSARCRWCGEPRLVAVLLPGHGDPEATVCLACGRAQPVEQEHRAAE